jgi:hypothetical protein
MRRAGVMDFMGAPSEQQDIRTCLSVGTVPPWAVEARRYLPET